MDWERNYFSLMSRAKRAKRTRMRNGPTYETHRIIPTSVGGSGSLGDWRFHPNVVLLSPREHFVAHLMLVKIYPEIGEIRKTFNRLSKNGELSSRAYETSKKKSVTFSWYTNGKKNLKVFEGEKVPAHFEKGFSLKEDTLEQKALLKSKKRKAESETLEGLKDLKKMSKKIYVYEKKRFEQQKRRKKKENDFVRENDLESLFHQFSFLAQDFEKAAGRVVEENELYNFFRKPHLEDSHPVNRMIRLHVLEYRFLSQLKNFPSMATSLQTFYEKNPQIRNPVGSILREINEMSSL